MVHVSTTSRGLLLSRVIPDGQWYGGKEIEISSCCVEAERCQSLDRLDRTPAGTASVERINGEQ